MSDLSKPQPPDCGRIQFHTGAIGPQSYHPPEPGLRVMLTGPVGGAVKCHAFGQFIKRIFGALICAAR
jgi:hypothetical protein